MKSEDIKTLQIANELLLPEVIRMTEEGYTVTLPLRGFSMRPFLEDGRDKALLCKPTSIEVGDAVLAEIAPKQYVLHRIVDISGDRVTLRGDGNLSDEHCRLDSTKGRKWRVYSYVWTRLFPIRRYLLAFYRRIWLKLFKPI